jgi:hypothetical protein
MGTTRDDGDGLRFNQYWQRQLRQLERENLLERIEPETGPVPHVAQLRSRRLSSWRGRVDGRSFDFNLGRDAEKALKGAGSLAPPRTSHRCATATV